MKHDLPNLDSLKVFEAAARHLSFSAAADELCITKGAVSYQIKKLESETGLSLFKRTTRQVFLTEAGQKLFQETQKYFSGLAQTLNNLKRPSADIVSIAVTTYVASRWLSPMITGFCERYPNISLQFVHNVNNDAFDIDNVDLAIRWGQCNGLADPIRLLEIPMPMFPVCNPQLARQFSDQNTTDNFAGCVLLAEDRETDLWKLWSDNKFKLDNNPQRMIPDANVRVQAAIDGQGLMLADGMMQTEITNGTLIVVDGRELVGYGYVIMSAASARYRSSVNLLVEWLLENADQSK